MHKDRSNEELERYLDVAVDAAKKAGEFLLKSSLSKNIGNITTKGKNDYVTEADRESEKIVLETLHESFPDHRFLAEESGGERELTGYVWIIDPLDGTTNFINGYPVWSVSIGLVRDGRIITGVIFDPIHDELFHAVRGRGAYLNDKIISISSETDFSRALILTGFPFKAQKYIDPYLQSFKEIFLRTSGIRRAGSASIDLAWLASGRADGFWELSLSPWDVAAGTLIVREAGGIVTDIHGHESRFMETGHIVASNKYLHPEILKITREIFAFLK